MIRLFLIFSVLLLATAGAVWMADHRGVVQIDFEGVQVTTSFAAIILLLGFTGVLAAFLTWFIGWLRAEMPIVGHRRNIKRQSRGFDLLNKSLVALSAGDPKLASRLIARAEVLLPPQPMVHLIAAEAASRSGNDGEAQKRYHTLAASDDGRLIGLRGQLNKAQQKGHVHEALKLARAALAENKNSPWAMKACFALEVAGGHWVEALSIMDGQVKAGFVTRVEAERHKAALYFAKATEASLRGASDVAIKDYQLAIKHRRDFAPATAALAKVYHSQGNSKKAVKLIKDGWQVMPHQSLRRAYRTFDVTESKAGWLQRVRGLVAGNPDHLESRMLLLGALMDAGEYAGAVGIMEQITADLTTADQKPTKNLAALKLRLAREAGDAVPEGYETQSLENDVIHAVPDPAWHCTDCGHSPTAWGVLCEGCGGFDTFEWRNSYQQTPVSQTAKTHNERSPMILLSD